MVKYSKAFSQFFRTCLAEEFEYRWNFVANVFTTLFQLALAVIVVNLYFYRTEQIGGWNYNEILVLLGIFTALEGFIAFFLQPNMSRLVEHIRKGTLDYVLTKPIDAQFYMSFRHLVIWRLFDVGLGFVLVGYAVHRMNVAISLEQWLMFAVVFIASLIVVYALWFAMMLLSFWTVRIDDLSFLLSSFFETARFPITVYRGILRMILTYVLPIALITTFPASAILGKLPLSSVIISLMIACGFFGLTRWFWLKALKNYTSASS